jgi:hypothetical protein
MNKDFSFKADGVHGFAGRRIRERLSRQGILLGLHPRNLDGLRGRAQENQAMRQGASTDRA